MGVFSFFSGIQWVVSGFFFSLLPFTFFSHPETLSCGRDFVFLGRWLLPN
jgi:hypothetical protein